MKWKLIGPFDHKGQNDLSFGPEYEITAEYSTNDTILKWQSQPVYGSAVQIKSLYDMFNAHRKQYKLNHWPTLMYLHRRPEEIPFLSQRYFDASFSPACPRQTQKANEVEEHVCRLARCPHLRNPNYPVRELFLTDNHQSAPTFRLKEQKHGKPSPSLKTV